MSKAVAQRTTVEGPLVTDAQRAIELGRPVVLLGAFVLAAHLVGPWAWPLGVISVFAVALLVHNLIHNALHFPKPWSAVTLSFFALFLLKSGHALRTSHIRHHQLCLTTADEEGRVAHASTLSLVVRGPWLALQARWIAYRHGADSRRAQALETALDLVAFAALLVGARLGSTTALLYLVSVVVVTVSAPIWGAKVPHTIPLGHPLVAWLRDRVGRWTPAASSVLFHELHHRAPRIPVALLAERRDEIERRPPSPCEAPPRP